MDYELLCPDNLDGVNIFNMITDKSGQSMNFYVDKCVGYGCQPNRDFIENIQVMTVGIFDKIDF
jgi:hypothetical protein